MHIGVPYRNTHVHIPVYVYIYYVRKCMHLYVHVYFESQFYFKENIHANTQHSREVCKCMKKI
jgi:hypothetical protein